MDNLRDLYQEVILDHNKNKQNYRKIEKADGFAHGVNPLCGDQIDVYLNLKDGVVADVSFELWVGVAPLFGGLPEEGDVEQVGFAGIGDCGLGFGYFSRD